MYHFQQGFGVFFCGYWSGFGKFVADFDSFRAGFSGF